MSDENRLREAVEAGLPAAIEARRTVHRHAELGWCELATTSYIRSRLADTGVDRIVWGEGLFRGIERLGVPEPATRDAAVASARVWGVPASEAQEMIEVGTGLVAEIDGSLPGPTVAVRADIDALPIEEAAGADHLPAVQGFASETSGIMHACGHDGHVAIGLGVARLLCDLRHRLHGRVRLLFQPAEEGTRGAAAFVEAGWLDDVQALVALHISGLSGLKTGTFSPGVSALLATTKFNVRFHGRAAHFASAPDMGRSALMAASAVALLSQAIPRRPGARALVNVGRVESGVARNVVPEHGELQMEVRAETDNELEDLYRRVQDVVEGIGKAMDVETDITVVGRSPAADSSDQLAAIVASEGSNTGLALRDGLTMEASDDAAAMMRRVQDRGGTAVYLKVGSDLAGGNHTPTFDFDEACLRGGIELVTRSVLACAAQASPEAL